jgi:hypothetical protein
MDQKTDRAMQEEPRARNDNREKTPVVTMRRPAVPKKLTSVEKLREAQVSKKGAVGLMLAAAVLTMIVGFNWGNWVTGGTSKERVTTGSQDAVTARLIPICVAQFNLDPQKTAKLGELKAITSSWEQPDYVKKQGWATMPGETSPDNDVASACAKLLVAN